MDPARTTLVLQVAFVLLAFGWRSLQQRRRTGSTGFVLQRALEHRDVADPSASEACWPRPSG